MNNDTGLSDAASDPSTDADDRDSADTTADTLDSDATPDTPDDANTPDATDTSPLDTETGDDSGATDTAQDTNTDDGDDGRDDTATDAADDTASDVTADASTCAYFEIDTRIASCGDSYIYLGLFRDIEAAADACPEYWQARGDTDRHATLEAAAAAVECDGTCVWRAAMSVTWLRCGVRSGYIRFDSPTCDPIFEMPEGLFTSLEAHNQAHPCPTRPAGQCVTSDDCPGISICSSSAPGGVCTGCGSFDDCPDSADECSDFGACRRMCDVDDDCPAGQECGVTGYCVIAQCVRGACPDARFDCNEGNRCERRACSDPTTECPDGTFCTSGYCVETP